MVTKFVPTPANSGGKQRSLAIVERLAARGPTVLCAFADDHADPRPLLELGVEVRSTPWQPSPATAAVGAAVTRSATSGRFWSAELHRQLVAAARAAPLDLLQVEYGQLVPYARGVDATLRVLDLHNVESTLVGRMASLRRQPVRLALALEASRLRALERTALREFDAVAVVSEADRARLAASQRTVLVCANGYDVSSVVPIGDERVVACVALLGWGPNSDAAVWLASAVWPHVLARVPDAKLLLVGRDPPERVRALG